MPKLALSQAWLIASEQLPNKHFMVYSLFRKFGFSGEFFMFISCYTARNEPKNRARGAPLDPLPPSRAGEMRDGTNHAIRSITSFGRSDPKDCVGDADTVRFFDDTVGFSAPNEDCIF